MLNAGRIVSFNFLEDLEEWRKEMKGDPFMIDYANEC
jgi:hypothetical protein